MESALGILAASLFHDTGYIMEDWDEFGTGAKYSQTHVKRGADFLTKHVNRFLIPDNRIGLIRKLVLATDYAGNINEIDYDSEEEHLAARILATSDFMGQMSNRIYLEKLLFLYYEFKEAGFPGYDTEYDILRKTVEFYDSIMNKLTDEYDSVYKFVKNHFRFRFDIDKNLIA